VLEVLRVVDEQVAVARRRPRADVRLVAQQRVGVEDEVAEVERALLGEQAVVRRIDGTELALALGPVVAGRQIGRPAHVLLGGHHRVLEAVDPGDDAGEERRRVAAEVVQAERQLVDVLEQHREAVGRRDRRDERVEARLERLVVQQARAEARDGVDCELLEPAVEERLDLAADGVGGRLGAREDEHLLRRDPFGGQPGVAVHERARLAGPGGAEDEQRPATMGRDGELGRGERAGRNGHVPRI